MLKLVINRLYKRYSPAGVEAERDRGLDLDEDPELAKRVNGERIRQCDVTGRDDSHKLLVKCSYLDNRYRPDLKAEDVECAKEQLLKEVEDDAAASTGESDIS